MGTSDVKGAKSKRKRVNPATVDQIVVACRRVCCMCYALQQDATTKPGQIAHLDDDPSNNDPDNLAYLCLAHHDDYDTKRRQTRNYTPGEVKAYRRLLLDAIAAREAPQPMSQVGASLKIRLKSTFLDTGFKSAMTGKRASLLYVCIGISNAGVMSTGIEGVRLYLGDRLLGDENTGLVSVTTTSYVNGRKETKDSKPDWFREDAEWLRCDRHQVVMPGEIRWVVAPFLIDEQDDLALLGELDSLYGDQKVVGLENAPLLEILPVIGAPIAVEIPEVRRFERH